MLEAQTEYRMDMATALVDEGDIDDAEYEDVVNENFDEPIEEKLAAVFKRVHATLFG
jgi:hypothetical protein